MKLDVLDLTGKKVGDIDLNDTVFQCEVNNQAIFDAVLRNKKLVQKYLVVVRNHGDKKVQVMHVKDL